MIGTTQKLTDDQIKVADALSKQMKNADAAFRRASSWIREGHKDFWDALNEMYPDLAEYICSYDDKEKEIIVIGKRR